MKAICPITGIPFRTYDSLPQRIACDHPIFSLVFENLILMLEDLHKQEDEELERIAGSNTVSDLDSSVATFEEEVKTLTSETLEAIHQKNWKSTAFRLYQSKHLMLIAFMKEAELLEHDIGYCARPSPRIIDAYFWRASELFIWAATISNPNLRSSIPKYKITKETERMDNLANYLEIITEIKDSFTAKYRTLHEENKLRQWERAITLLARRKEATKKKLLSGNSALVAKWALTITRCPKDMWDFWYGILISNSIKITFDGVKVEDKYQVVSIGDLRELRDYLEENLIGPAGEQIDKKKKTVHEDDSEYYFMARHIVLEIIRRHIAIFEQGTGFTFDIVNAATKSNILSLSDDRLEEKALKIGLSPMPKFADFVKKIDFIKAIAAWRTDVKGKLLNTQDKGKGNYEIL